MFAERLLNRVIAEDKKHSADEGEQNKLCTNIISLEEKRFDSAAPKSLKLLGGQQIQNVPVHKFEGFVAPAGPQVSGSSQ